MIPFAITCSCTLVFITTCFVTGLSPMALANRALTLLIRAALRLQGAVLWLRWYAWPAVLRERHQYRYCVDEAQRRLFQSVRHEARGPVEAKTFSPPPGEARLNLREAFTR